MIVTEDTLLEKYPNTYELKGDILIVIGEVQRIEEDRLEIQILGKVKSFVMLKGMLSDKEFIMISEGNILKVKSKVTESTLEIITIEHIAYYEEDGVRVYSMIKE